jgi:DNA-directed RNA polymerase specialized sigma24 family protein
MVAFARRSDVTSVENRHQLGSACRAEPLRGQPGDVSGARTDAELLAGSRADFGVLFDRHGAEIYRYCAHRVGSDEADDVVAETFAASYQRRDRFDGSRDNALPWLYGIATNMVHRHRGAEARRQRLLSKLEDVELDYLFVDGAAACRPPR